MNFREHQLKRRQDLLAPNVETAPIEKKVDVPNAIAVDIVPVVNIEDGLHEALLGFVGSPINDRTMQEIAAVLKDHLSIVYDLSYELKVEIKDTYEPLE